MKVGRDGSSFSGYGINLRVPVSVNTMMGLIGKGHHLLYVGGVLWVNKQAERILLDSRYPSFDIVGGNLYVSCILSNVVRRVCLSCCQRCVFCCPGNIAVRAKQTKAIACRS